MKSILGIDIGGTGIKGALVDVKRGKLITERFRLKTPQPATPESVSATVQMLVEHFQWEGAVGCGFPAAIQRGVVRTAANISPEWIGCNVESLLSARTGLPFKVINDADAAGVAEMRFGVGAQLAGSVMMLTLGTGIGSALFSDGQLLPNTELGHLEMNGMEMEHYASNAVREREALDWEQWASRLNEVLDRYHVLLWPDAFIIGGGVSKKHEHFFHLLNTEVPVFAAKKKNNAGIIGSAVFSYEHFKRQAKREAQQLAEQLAPQDPSSEG